MAVFKHLLALSWFRKFWRHFDLGQFSIRANHKMQTVKTAPKVSWIMRNFHRNLHGVRVVWSLRLTCSSRIYWRRRAVLAQPLLTHTACTSTFTIRKLLPFASYYYSQASKSASQPAKPSFYLAPSVLREVSASHSKNHRISVGCVFFLQRFRKQQREQPWATLSNARE